MKVCDLYNVKCVLNKMCLHVFCTGVPQENVHCNQWLHEGTFFLKTHVKNMKAHLIEDAVYIVCDLSGTVLITTEQNHTLYFICSSHYFIWAEWPYLFTHLKDWMIPSAS